MPCLIGEKSNLSLTDTRISTKTMGLNQSIIMVCTMSKSNLSDLMWYVHIRNSQRKASLWFAQCQKTICLILCDMCTSKTHKRGHPYGLHNVYNWSSQHYGLRNYLHYLGHVWCSLLFSRLQIKQKLCKK